MKTLALLIWLVALWAIQVVQAGEFFCQSGDVTCLISAIDKANNKEGEHTITLEPGIYTLQAINNGNVNGLPVISSSIHIQVSADDQPTIIERDPNAPAFRIFDVSSSGNLSLTGLTLQMAGGVSSNFGGIAISNQGKISLQDSVVRNNSGNFGATITNFGTLNLFRTMVANNVAGLDAGGILNWVGGTALIEFSTIAHNFADGSGGIRNLGAMVVRNSSIIFNSSGGTGAGAGIGNGGSLEIISSTIARNLILSIFFGNGGGISNVGFVSITNSTIRENQVLTSHGGGIWNGNGTVTLQNTIVAGNTLIEPNRIPGLFATGPDCSGMITSIGNNLIGDPSDCNVNLQSTDLTGEPGLDALVGAGEEDFPGRAYYPVLAGSAVLNSGNPAACPSTDQLANPRVGDCDIGAIESQDKLLVAVDLRPRSDANKINPNSTKIINVAIFSVNGFDANTIDSNTVRFGATGTEAAPIHVGRRDVDADGDRDMILRFQIQDTAISCGDTSALLTGQIAGGASIMGSAPIKTVQCRQKNPKIAVKIK